MLGEGVEQLCVFAVFWVLGVAFSALYIFGVGLTKPKIAAIVFDSIFGACAIFVVWKVNLEVNNGECRAFLFVGLVLGCLTTYFTCKRTLDKLSAMLYNLFTTKLVDDDGKDILKENDSGIIYSGDADSGVASLHATGNSDTNVLAKSSRRRTKQTDTVRQKQRRRSKKTARALGTRRVREKVGRRSQQN